MVIQEYSPIHSITVGLKNEGINCRQLSLILNMTNAYFFGVKAVNPRCGAIDTKTGNKHEFYY